MRNPNKVFKWGYLFEGKSRNTFYHGVIKFICTEAGYMMVKDGRDKYSKKAMFELFHNMAFWRLTYY